MGNFLERGYSLAEIPEEADLILVNTCSVREHAEDRAISFLGSLKQFYERRRTRGAEPKVIGLIGCMAKNRGEEIFEKMQHVSLVCGPGCFDRLPEYAEKVLRENIRIIDLDDKERDDSFYGAPYRIEPQHGQVVISTGCSNYCSYCVVPYVRGALRLRKPENIIAEVRKNVKLGKKSITLLGQNVNDYCFEGDDEKTNFVDLLSKVIAIDGVKEVDFISAHPKNTSEELISLIAKSDKIKKHLHLPFQSGSDKILQLMNRGYTKKEYFELVNDYRKITGGSLSTDIIVGFPGETDSDFEQTRDVVDQVRFKYAYIFKYSTRPGTSAAKLEDNVPEKIKKQRHQVLLSLQKEISMEEK